jgi:hypothetical protein
MKNFRLKVRRGKGHCQISAPLCHLQIASRKSQRPICHAPNALEIFQRPFAAGESVLKNVLRPLLWSMTSLKFFNGDFPVENRP